DLCISHWFTRNLCTQSKHPNILLFAQLILAAVLLAYIAELLECIVSQRISEFHGKIAAACVRVFAGAWYKIIGPPSIRCVVHLGLVSEGHRGAGAISHVRGIRHIGTRLEERRGKKVLMIDMKKCAGLWKEYSSSRGRR